MNEIKILGGIIVILCLVILTQSVLLNYFAEELKQIKKEREQDDERG